MNRPAVSPSRLIVRLALLLALQWVGLCIAYAQDSAAPTLAQLRALKQKEVSQVEGSPGRRVVIRSVRYVTRWRVDHEQEQRKYEAGLQDGRKAVLASLDAAPAPAELTRLADAILPKLNLPARTRAVHKQELTARFIDGNGRPMANTAFVPVVAARGEGRELLPPRDLPAVTSDPEGRVVLKDLPVPCEVTWKLPETQPRVAGDVPEWTFKNPRQAELALSEYGGSPRVTSARFDLHLPLVAAHRPRRLPPLGTIQVASINLTGLALFAAPPKAPAKPTAKPGAKPPAKPAINPQARVLAQSAFDLLRIAEEDLQSADERLLPQDDVSRTRALQRLREVLAKADQAGRLQKGKYPQAIVYQARALYWTASKEEALTRLRQGLRLIPGDPLLREALDQLEKAPDAPERLLNVATRRLAAAEKALPAGLSAVQAQLELVVSEAAEVTRLNPELQDAYVVHGRALAQLGRSEEALASLRRGASRFPNNKELHEIIEQLAQPKEVTVVHRKDAGDIVLRRTVVDFVTPLPTDVRAFVPSVLLATPGAEQPQKAGEAEIAIRRDADRGRFRLPDYAFEKHPLPVRLARSTDVGEWEAVVPLVREKANPYAPENPVGGQKLSLVRINQVDLKGIDVLDEREDVEERLGPLPEPLKPDDKKARPNVVRELADLQSWWVRTPQQAIHMRVHPTADVFEEDSTGTPLKGSELKNRLKAPAYVDEIQLLTPDAGNVAGFSVGGSGADLVKALDEPELRTRADGEELLSYLQGGVVYRVADGKIRRIDVRRPSRLLKSGTTAFASRGSATVYIADFSTQPECSFDTREKLARYLEGTGSLRVVATEDEADCILETRLTKLKVEAKNILKSGDIQIPIAVEGAGELEYRLRERGAEAGDWEKVSNSAQVDWAKEAGFGAAALVILNLSGAKPNVSRLLTLIGGVAGFAKLQTSMDRTRRRLPQVLEHGLYDRLASRLYDTIAISARATEVDVAAGKLRIPLGRKDGLSLGDDKAPVWFDVRIAGEELPGREQGLSATFYAAKVVEVGEESSLCRIVRVKRGLSKHVEETTSVDDANYMLARLPHAASGAVTVRLRPVLVQ